MLPVEHNRLRTLPELPCKRINRPLERIISLFLLEARKKRKKRKMKIKYLPTDQKMFIGPENKEKGSILLC
jgi:hypothetical protein